jgi:hypothetical protein
VTARPLNDHHATPLGLRCLYGFYVCGSGHRGIRIDGAAQSGFRLLNKSRTDQLVNLSTQGRRHGLFCSFFSRGVVQISFSIVPPRWAASDPAMKHHGHDLLPSAGTVSLDMAPKLLATLVGP